MTHRAVMLGAVAIGIAANGCTASRPAGGETHLWEQTRLNAALQLADDHVRAGKFDRARALLVSHATGNDERARLALARVDLEEGGYAAAAGRLEAIPVERRDSVGYDDAWALTLEGLGRWSEAAVAYGSAYRREPTVIRFAAWLDALVLAEKIDAAREALRAERGRFPGQPVLHETAARLHTHAGDHDAAIHELRAALLCEPESAALQRRLADAYVRAERYADAIPIWRDLTASADNDRSRLECRRRWARCLLAAGECDNAARVYRAMRLTEPEDVEGHLGFAAAVLAGGRPAEAVDPARRALELSPDNADARLALACAYADQGQHAKAVQVLSENPRDGQTDALVRKLLARWRSQRPTSDK